MKNKPRYRVLIVSTRGKKIEEIKNALAINETYNDWLSQSLFYPSATIQAHQVNFFVKR